MRVLLVAFAVLGLFGCQQDFGQVPPGPVCDGNSRHYRDLADGKELCDTQVLVAPLSPTVVDARAGQGALHVPFRVTQREVRSYCFNDDNNERHELSLRNERGAEVLHLVAGEFCKDVTLDEGVYVMRFEHETVGGVDIDPDVIHTRLLREGESTVFRIDVNACPGCWLRNIDWPCHGAESKTYGRYAACGFSGNYAKAYFDRVVCRSDQGYGHTECYLDGNFDGATFTFGSFVDDRLNDTALVLGTASDAPSESPGTPRTPSSFTGVSFPWGFYAGPNLQGYSPRLLLRDTARLTGEAFDLARFEVDNSSPSLEVDRTFATGLQGAKAFTGQRTWLSVKFPGNADFSNLRWDFSRVTLMPELVRGGRSLQGANFENSELVNMAPIRTGDEEFALGITNFRNARISNSVIDATDLYLADFRGAKLSNVQFAAKVNARINARSVDLRSAVLTDVTFGSKTDTSASSFGYDLTELKADGVTLKDVFARNSVFTRGRFVGASVDGFSATGSDFSGANFGALLSFSRVTLSYSLLRPYTDAGATTPFVLTFANPAAPLDALVLVGSVLDVDFSNKALSRLNMSYATISGNFTDARIQGATLVNAVIAKEAAFTRARIENSQFNGAHIAGDFDKATVLGSSFTGVTFVASTTTDTTFDGGDLGSAHFCGDGKYAATKFLRVGMGGLVMPLKGTSFPDISVPLKPGEERCAGGITAVERDALVTSTANNCPDGSVPVAMDCRGDQWIPMASSVSPTCCMPARGSSCNPFVPGQVCVSDCQCASKKCNAGICGS